MTRRPIRRLFVANRGEIARRVIRTAHEMGIETAVAFATADAGAPFVEEAGAAVQLEGRSAAGTYLDQAKLLEAASRTRCDAVHPGYGFLSENASFARAVAGAGLTFVGPPPEAMEVLGDKLRARREAAALGIPILGSGDDEPGRPVIIKAAGGGGGRGMRIVGEGADLDEAMAAARREAASAFGDDRVFVEQYVANARHVEVQVLGDSRGNLVHCFERECSIQRRHQKVVEEAPSVAVTPELREAMCDSALRIARAARYESAGTVEFLLDDDGRYFLLEVNTRLQVEHPVTEAVTGLDLVREQLLIAEGAPLSFSQGDLALDGHAVEGRLYAEDVAAGYLPAAGRVALFRRATEPAVRYDAGVESGSAVPVEYDPLLAKVVAHAATRREATARLALALGRTVLAGIATNREHLVAILRHEVFLAGEATTSFLADHRLPARLDPGAGGLELAAVLAALTAEEESRRGARVLSSLPSGWRASVMPAERRRFRAGEVELAVDYRRSRDGSYELAVSRHEGGGDSTAGGGKLHRAARVGAGVVVDGVHRRVSVDNAGRSVVVGFEDGASVELTELPRFPEPEAPPASGALVAPMPGTVLSLHAGVGDEVAAGQLLVVVEAMKMEHRITAPFTGSVREVHAVAGAQVASGDLLVALDPAASRAAPDGAREGA